MARSIARSGAIALLATLPLLPSCGGGNDTPLPPVEPAQPPLARLWLPVFASPAVSLVFDASDSQSPGGSVAHYQFDYGDGSPLDDLGTPFAGRTYANEGVYAVQLTVVDLAGNTAQVQSQLTVRDAAPVCTTDADCDAGGRCQPQTCALNPPCTQICLIEVGSAVGSETPGEL